MGAHLAFQTMGTGCCDTIGMVEASGLSSFDGERSYCRKAKSAYWIRMLLTVPGAFFRQADVPLHSGKGHPSPG